MFFIFNAVPAHVTQTAAAAASTFIVTKVTDTYDGACDADCSLREALAAANASPGADAITLPVGIFLLTRAGAGEDACATGDLDITGDVTITGAGASSTVIDGSRLDRVFHIPSTQTVTINGVMLRYGKVEDAGGGILINSNSLSGVTQLNGVVIAMNTSTNGGGIAIPNGGQLNIHDSTIHHNTTTGSGGGIQSYNAVVSMVNTTLTGNTASGGGGGGAIYQFRGLEAGAIHLTNSTLAYNSSSVGSAVANYGGTVNLANTIFSTNSGPACTGTLTSLGYNLIQDPGCTLQGVLSGNIIGQSPNLGPLQNNGGATPTHALPEGSLAVNAGSSAAPGSGGSACAATDQRGIARPQNGRCDIGAYEQTAGATILGSVYNSVTQSNVAGVFVRLDFDHFGGSPSFNATSDLFGSFSFMNIPPGNYFLLPFPPSGWIGAGRMLSVTGAGTYSFPLSLIKDIALLSPPNGSAIETPTPNLCWEPLAQAAAYVLQLNGPGGTLLANPTVTGTCYRVAAELQDAATYTWSLANVFNSQGESIGGSQDFRFTYHAAPIEQPILPSAVTTITSWDENTVLAFPPGSFGEAGTVTYQPVAAPPSPSYPLSTVKAYDIRASAPLQDDAQYQVTYTYSPADTRTFAPDSLAFYYWDPATQQWLKEPTSQLDPLSHTLTAAPTHFSTWAVLGERHWIYLPILRR